MLCKFRVCVNNLAFSRPHRKSLEAPQSLLRLLQRIIEGNRIVVSIIAGGGFIYFSTPTPTSILISLPFILTGEGLRTWSSGFIKKDAELAQEGPYALSRNPLYLGNFFIGTGFAMMANNLWLYILFLIIFFLIYSVTIKNEERNLLNKFGETFEEYKKRVPVFFPWPGYIKYHGQFINFDWHLVMKHREHNTWLGIIGCMLIFIVKSLY